MYRYVLTKHSGVFRTSRDIFTSECLMDLIEATDLMAKDLLPLGAITVTDTTTGEAMYMVENTYDYKRR